MDAQQITQAAAMALRKVSLPLREPAYNRPPFWAYTFNQTKTRPIPAGSGWIDYLLVQLGQSPGTAPVGYSLVVNQYIATGEASPITSGLRYRFLVRGAQLRDEEFDITDDIERHVNHAAARPWPAMQRRTFIQLGNQQRLVLQVNNTGVASTLAFASLSGWYYPNLGDMPRGSQEAGSQQDQDRFNG